MIEHQGIITAILDKKISVKILQQSACSSCHAKGACMAADSKEKTIEVTNVEGNYKLNDLVTLECKESMGYRAVLWAFVVPVVILVSTIIVATSAWRWGETEAAVASVLALAPYYLLLYFLRHKMAGSFKFTIKNNH